MKHSNAGAQCKALIDQSDYNGVLQILLREPNNVEVLYCSGLAYEAMGNTDNAVKCWRKALIVSKDLGSDEDPSVLRALATHYSENIQTLDHAAAMLESLDDNGNSNSGDMALLAEIYMQQGKLEDSHYCFVDAIEQDPESVGAYTGHAILHARWALKQIHEAQKHGEINLDDLPDDPELRFLMFTLARFSKDAHQQTDKQ